MKSFLRMPLVRCFSRPSSSDYSSLFDDQPSLGLAPEVEEYQEFLKENGGHRGNWEEYDHRIFLKCRTKHKGRPGFIEDVAERLCSQTIESVTKHEEWYQTYMEKRRKQALAIKEWRSARKTFKKKIEKEDHHSNHKCEPNKADIEQVKEAIAVWKKNVQLEKQAQREKALLEEQMYLKAAMEKRKKHEIETHKTLESFRQVREAQRRQEQELQREREKQELMARLNNKIPLSHFLKKDADRLAQKRNKHELLLKENAERQLRLEKLIQQVSITATKDPERLTKATKAWQEKTMPVDSPEQVVRAPFKLPKRGIPVWRRGLTF